MPSARLQTSRKIPMNIVRVASGLCALVSLSACATKAVEAPAATAASAAPASAASFTAGRLAPGAEPVAPASAPPAPAPQSLDKPEGSQATARDEEEFTTLEAAERALQRAKSDLDRVAWAEPEPRKTHNADGAEKKDARRAQAPSAAGAAEGATASGQCENACRAFASLSRAANAVCRLDGDGG